MLLLAVRRVSNSAHDFFAAIADNGTDPFEDLYQREAVLDSHSR